MHLPPVLPSRWILRLIMVAAWTLAASGAAHAAAYPAQPAAASGLICLSDSGVMCFGERSMTRRWHALPGNYCFAPTIAAARVLVGSSVGLHALNALNGSPEWSWNDGRGVASPVVDAGTVYAAGHNGRIASLTLADGEANWQRRLGGRLYTPALLGDRVIAGGRSGVVYALDRESGQTLWTHSLDHAMLDRPVAAADGVVVTTFGGTAMMLTPRGEVRWRHADGVPGYGPAVAGDLLVFGGADGRLRARNRETGAIQWRAELSGRLSIPARVRGGQIGVVNPDGDLAVVSSVDGAVLKRTTLPGSPLGSPVPLDNGHWRAFYRESGDVAWTDIAPR